MGASLILVPTPIGNLGDMTPRALEVLGDVDCVLAEDTRTTGKLMRHFGIDNRLQSFHVHNEHKQAEGLVKQMCSGQTFALCSDAGTPGISDPGFLLVRAAIEAGLEVHCLPGPAAFVSAVAASGLPCDRFVYEGFLPHKKGRQSRIDDILEREVTTVLYESPHRVVKLLDALHAGGCEERTICLSREISKLHEEHLRGTAQQLLERLEKTPPRGEYVVVIAGKP
ncbi:MAG: 16S rRNA (cytidine(1402)-2'-O)-methyltransferase [Flavobacteriales bacterium]